VRFRKTSMWTALGLILATAACGVDASGLSGSAQDQLYEGYRQVAEKTVQNLGFSNAKATLEDQDTTPASTGPSKEPSQAAPSASNAPTYKLIKVTFLINGTVCTGEVQQRLEPVGSLYFKGITLPNGTVKTKDSKPPVQMNPLEIFQFAYSFNECRVAGITAPPPAAPTASGATGMGANPAATS
jgi:hypothetical protein